MGDMSWPDLARQKGLIGFETRTGPSPPTLGTSSPLSCFCQWVPFVLALKKIDLSSSIKTFYVYICTFINTKMYLHKLSLLLCFSHFIIWPSPPSFLPLPPKPCLQADSTLWVPIPSHITVHVHTHTRWHSWYMCCERVFWIAVYITNMSYCLGFSAFHFSLTL